MRVLLLTHSFWPDNSPPQRRWSAFTNLFASHGHHVSVVAPDSSSSSSRVEGLASEPVKNVTVHNYRSVPVFHSMLGKLAKHVIDACRSVPVALSVSNAEVVIATVPALPTLAVGFFVSKVRRIPFVVDLRDAWPDLLKDSQVLKFRWIEPIVSGLLGYLLRRSDLLVTTTHGLARRLGKTRTGKTIVVRNGVDTARILPTSDALPRGERLRILYLGNLGRSQGLEIVIEAVSKIQDQVQLRIVGRGTEESKLRRLAKKLNCDVDFRPPVFGAEVLDNYAWADTCLVSLRPDWPSFNHTIPSKLYELMALDQHVTGVVTGEAAEVIHDSQAGAVIGQSVEAIRAYLQAASQDRSLVRTKGGGPRWVAHNAALEDLGADYMAALESLIDNHRRRGVQ
ncbi:glycosyltransferase family 4 protein [Glutamicibacter endophyticus]|uniref:glycosyltransferase family 4 protein n=1 Tax=Glutamicibacter endophyticus TaxID=1522174 RepID=UPI003AF0F7B3